jgi:hypothetical protein
VEGGAKLAAARRLAGCTRRVTDILNIMLEKKHQKFDE